MTTAPDRDRDDDAGATDGAGDTTSTAAPTTVATTTTTVATTTTTAAPTTTTSSTIAVRSLSVTGPVDEGGPGLLRVVLLVALVGFGIGAASFVYNTVFARR